MKPVYPYQNLSLTSIKGERWKPVPGFEGYYNVSSFGRVKSLARERPNRGGMMRINEKILRARIGTAKNKTVDDTLYFLVVTLYLEGIRYYYSVGRLVYDAFVAPFDLGDRMIMISYKDGDGRNLHYKNLVLTNISALRNQSYENGRFKSDLRIPVSQFDTEGNLIAQYPSMYEAGRQLGIGQRAIAAIASGNGTLYKGFIWQAGYGKRLKKDKLIKKIDGGVNWALQSKQEKGVTSIMPSANLSLANLTGERWKDFPGYEGLYKISSYGRVKALRKISEGKQQQWYPECMKKLTAAGKKAGSKNSGLSLIVTLYKGRKRKTYSVSRYVYYLFVKEFALTDSTQRVYQKDGSPYNLHYKNLMLKNAVWSIAAAQK